VQRGLARSTPRRPPGPPRRTNLFCFRFAFVLTLPREHARSPSLNQSRQESCAGHPAPDSAQPERPEAYMCRGNSSLFICWIKAGEQIKHSSSARFRARRLPCRLCSAQRLGAAGPSFRALSVTKFGLWHRAFCGIGTRGHTVYHRQDAFKLRTKVGRDRGCRLMLYGVLFQTTTLGFCEIVMPPLAAPDVAVHSTRVVRRLVSR